MTPERGIIPILPMGFGPPMTVPAGGFCAVRQFAQRSFWPDRLVVPYVKDQHFEITQISVAHQHKLAPGRVIDAREHSEMNYSERVDLGHVRIGMEVRIEARNKTDKDAVFSICLMGPIHKDPA